MRMNLKMILLTGAAVASSTLATAQVFPTAPYSRTFDLLLSERTSENVLRLRDLDQDGDYNDAGEAFVFFTNGPATVSGITLASTVGIACAPNGTAYVVTSSSDEVVALRDLNGDGDADDASEARVFFSSANNASGILLGSAQSITVDALGRVVVLTSGGGTPTVGIDAILILQDLTPDGDAEDAGEAFYWCQIPNASGSGAHSLPSEFAIAADGSIFYSDIGTGGPVAKGIYRAQDLNASGTANDPGEVTLWWVPPFTGTGVSWYGMAFDAAGNLYVSNHGSGNRNLYRAFDTNGIGGIDASEQLLCYSTASSTTFWDLALRDDGTLLMIDGTANVVLSLRDLTNDGDFFDPGEVVNALDVTVAGFPTADPRAMAFLRAPQLTMSSPVSIGTPATWYMQTAEPFDLAVAFGAASIVPPIPVPPFGNLEIDPSTLILFGLAVSDVACQASYTLVLASDPALLGTYGCQAWCGELSRMFLSNPAPFTIQ